MEFLIPLEADRPSPPEGQVDVNAKAIMERFQYKKSLKVVGQKLYKIELNFYIDPVKQDIATRN